MTAHCWTNQSNETWKTSKADICLCAGVCLCQLSAADERPVISSGLSINVCAGYESCKNGADNRAQPELNDALSSVSSILVVATGWSGPRETEYAIQ